MGSFFISQKLENLGKFNSDSKGTSFVIGDLGVCLCKYNISNPNGQFQLDCDLPLVYKDTNFIALMNSDSEVSRHTIAVPIGKNAIRLTNFGGAKQLIANVIVLGRI